ncbi:selenide, water dikinase SelD [Alkalibacter rhizosphaerae]|uniref:Selenide, water dikinase n=1 Tax=Alkalibacter rhizosphaerae TaxID=2815577 RepID=A0A974XI38_9FIRM|nr:selenide, water dikinase SelD [Alkalibacter rhizosphaerae]QSX09095.1 selenide, water dikinase SelD [Alkalibacter rhizosphaerae]
MIALNEDILFCKGGGCTAKLGAGALSSVLEKLPKKLDPNLLVGFDSADDGAVYQLTEDLAVVQTLDFFPPMVEDPYQFGQIAAANALSDLYAMGATVKTALNIVCFPESMDLNILGKILQGGNDKVMEAGGVLVGGHSIADQDVKYGLSVMGTVHPNKILKNNTPKAGDRLILTKPLGVGIVMTAQRMGQCDPKAMEQAVTSMTTLNKYAAEMLFAYDIHACTDVTGFGFIGHLREMLGAYKGAQIDSIRIPHIRHSRRYANEFFYTAAGQRNRNHFQSGVVFQGVPFAMEEILYDPQTSGGLLVSLPADEAEIALAEVRKLGLDCGIVGTVTQDEENKIVIR